MAKAAVKVKEARLNKVSVPAEVGINVILGLFSLACIIPFIFVIIISFTDPASIREIGYSFVPRRLSAQAYKYVMAMGPIVWKSYFNSFFITIVGTVVSVLVCTLFIRVVPSGFINTAHSLRFSVSSR